ncbi:MAG: thiamine-phosphate kinase [Gammaproteobacteria bacterium]
MEKSEFDLIHQYFMRGIDRQDVVLGVGDDAAILKVPDGKQLVMSVDTLIEGVHFFPVTDPELIGYKALAVNLSDLAAMGAEPAWFTLALTLPQVDEDWLLKFSQGLYALADSYQVALVGGDTTRGPLSITIQISGFCDTALRRNGARTGQLIMVSGTFGNAAAAVAGIKAGKIVADELLQYLHKPQPRIGIGALLAGRATACIDISDGLLADLGHLLEASQCGARIQRDAIPQSAVFRAQSYPDPWIYILNGGDDYELCFTLDPDLEKELINEAAAVGVILTTIGVVREGQGIDILTADGHSYQLEGTGYDHFG